MSEKNKKPIAEQIQEFEALIAWFDSDSFSLEEALAKYEQAKKLSHSIEVQLQDMKNDVTVLKQKFDQ